MKSVLCYVDDNNVLHALDAETLDFSSSRSWPLPLPVVLGPVTIGSHIFLVAGNAEMICVDTRGKLAWRHVLGGETVAGFPFIGGETVYITMTSGLVQALSLSDGKQRWVLKTEKYLAGGVVSIADMLVVAGGDGSLNVLRVPMNASD